MTHIDGKNISDCFAFISDFAGETEALNQTLVNLFNEGLSDPKYGLKCEKVSNRWSNSWREDKHKWITTDFSNSTRLISSDKRKKNKELFMGFQVSIVGDGTIPDSNFGPLLHVFLFEDKVDFKEGIYMGWPLKLEDNPHVINKVLTVWDRDGTKDGDWDSWEWVFSLKLVALKSMEDLQKQVVGPALALLARKDVKDALPETLDALILQPPTPLTGDSTND